jgi:hypothetical protein
MEGKYMGCDIHVMLEQRVKTKSCPEGVWQVLNTFNGMDLHSLWYMQDITLDDNKSPMAYWNVEGRNYEFFAALASVRGHGRPEKGLPSDISPMVEAWVESWEGDGHSHSWDYADDFTKLYMKYCLSEQVVAEYAAKRLNGDISGDIWTHIMHKYISPIPNHMDNPQDLRFIYFFDN